MAALVYVPRIDDLYTHAQRFGVPLSLTTWPAFVGDIWTGIGPRRWHLLIVTLAVVGNGLLLFTRRSRGFFLLAVLSLPPLFSLAVSTGGEPRVYVYLLPFVSIALATAADRFVRWLHARLQHGSSRMLAVAAFVPLCAAFSNLPSRPTETGYRDTGRWIRQHTRAGDVVVVPYIVDSAIGYYSGGMTVQRVREAVGGVERLFFVTRPGTARFDVGDLMLASNFTTEVAGHRDTYRNYSLPAGSFEAIASFALTTVSQPREPPVPIDLGKLTRSRAWRLFARTSVDSAQWSAHVRPDGQELLRLDVQDGAVVLHTMQTFVTRQSGLLLLGYSKRGTGYASVFEIAQGQPQARQMAKSVSASARSVVDGDDWYHELYLLPVEAGVEYGVYLTAAGGVSDLADWGLYFVPM